MNENELLKFIRERRSIRKYTGQRISDDTISDLIITSMYAPSAVNKQPWHYIVLNNIDEFRKITAFHPNASFLEKASHAIIICGDTNLHHDEGYYVVDCSAATQNLLLAAHALGLGSCWIGLHPRIERKENVRRIYNLPGNIEPFSIVALGYPAETKATPERYKAERISYNAWGNRIKPL